MIGLPGPAGADDSLGCARMGDIAGDRIDGPAACREAFLVIDFECLAAAGAQDEVIAARGAGKCGDPHR
jgi:hypothetical protein